MNSAKIGILFTASDQRIKSIMDLNSKYIPNSEKHKYERQNKKQLFFIREVFGGVKMTMMSYLYRRDVHRIGPRPAVI